MHTHYLSKYCQNRFEQSEAYRGHILQERKDKVVTFAFTNNNRSLDYSCMGPDLLSDRVSTWPVIINNRFHPSATVIHTGTAWLETPYPWILREAFYSDITEIVLISIIVAVLLAIKLLHERCLHGAYVRVVALICPSSWQQAFNLITLLKNQKQDLFTYKSLKISYKMKVTELQ
jgi:hypothetical protein